MAAKYREITKYLAAAVCTQPLHIGSASGEKAEVLIHPADGMPFIQATSISGVFRQYCERVHGAERAAQLFGLERGGHDGSLPDNGSRVRFSDGSFCKENLILELRPRVKINPESGTCDAAAIKGTDNKAGQKFNTEYIGAGAELEFSVYVFDKKWQEDMEELFAALHRGTIRLGGQKSSGCGLLELKSLKRMTFDLTAADGRRRWADEESLPEHAYADILEGIQSRFMEPAAAYEVTVSGATEGELLIKSIAVPDCGEDAPDCMNLRNAKKEYIIPGSSLKGAIRSRMEKIASYLNVRQVIRETFGYTGSADGDGKAGNITFYDTVVGDMEENDLAPLRKRIHIDKFTGGVINGGLFCEKNIAGRLVLRIVIDDKNGPACTCGLLLMALRDMAIGTMSLGSGYGVGKGIISVKEITVRSCKSGAQAVLDFENGTVGDAHMVIEECMKALREEAT